MAVEDNIAAYDDGLVTPEVGAWTEQKHRLVSLYATLFSSAMKTKWSRRIYVELYAGAGYSRIRDSSKIIFGSPLRALRVKDPFDRYVFCEEKPTKISALKTRVGRIALEADVAYVQATAINVPRKYWHKFQRDQPGT